MYIQVLSIGFLSLALRFRLPRYLGADLVNSPELHEQPEQPTQAP